MHRDPNTLDLTQQRLRMADDVRVWPVRERGELVYRIEIPSLHRFFRVGHEEYVFISLLDGSTTIPQACGLAAKKLGSRAPTSTQAGTIARWLLQNELAYLESDGPPVRRAFTAMDSIASGPAGLVKKLNPFWIKVPLPYSDVVLNVCSKMLRSIFAPQAVLLGIVLMIGAAGVLFTRWTEFITSTASIFHPTNWIWLLLAWVMLKVVHELAHAVACDRQGAEVKEAGLVFILFAPLAFVDVTSCWRMNSRWSRIAVAAAGMYVELVIAAAAIVCWAFVEDPQSRFLLQNLVITASLSTLLFNANFLMRFDGYYIVSDLIEIPNLYGEAEATIRRLATQAATGEQAGKGVLSGWRKHFVLIYGLAALIWRIVICFSLGVAASTMFAGAGIAITLIGLMIWFGGPLMRLYQFAADLRLRDPNRFVRGMLVSGATVCAFVWLMFWCPLPTAVRVPAVARYLPETMMRSRASGFISKIHVADGDRVEEGDLLVELENRELVSELQQLEVTFQQNEIRLRRAIERHEPSERQVLQEDQKAITQQLDQLRSQAGGLRLVATRAGRVVAHGLEARLATYVEEGDPLLVVASESDKELVALIDQDVVEEVRSHVGRMLRIRSASFDTVTGRLDRIEPRATDRLPDPSMAASEGGSLAVQPVTDKDDPEAVRLLEPHFRGRVVIQPDVAAEVPAGMRMRVSVGYRTEPIASRVRRTIRRIWHKARDQSKS
jgi:putative peptide zinc metalloprotease protein